jgi:hypothetical protein
MAETRKIAAILVADVVGYSRLAGADEEGTLARLRALGGDLIDPAIALRHGRIVKRTGDGFISEFRSVVDAVRCAIEVQNGMVERNAGVAPEKRIEFRVGVHLGDVVEEADGDLALDPAFAFSRAHTAWAAMSDDPTFLAQLQPVFDGIRKAGYRSGNRRASRCARPLPTQRSLRRREAGDRDAEGGARDIVEPRLFAEGDRGGIAAVLAADAELEVGTGLAAALSGDRDELANAFGVQGHEWIGLEQPFDSVDAEKGRGVVARQSERGLGEIVGAEREELGGLRDFAGS